METKSKHTPRTWAPGTTYSGVQEVVVKVNEILILGSANVEKVNGSTGHLGLGSACRVVPAILDGASVCNTRENGEGAKQGSPRSNAAHHCSQT